MCMMCSVSTAAVSLIRMTIHHFIITPHSDDRDTPTHPPCIVTNRWMDPFTTLAHDALSDEVNFRQSHTHLEFISVDINLLQPLLNICFMSAIAEHSLMSAIAEHVSCQPLLNIDSCQPLLTISCTQLVCVAGCSSATPAFPPQRGTPFLDSLAPSLVSLAPLVR